MCLVQETIPFNTEDWNWKYDEIFVCRLWEGCWISMARREEMNICKCGHYQHEHWEGVSHCRVGMIGELDQRETDECVFFIQYNPFGDAVAEIRNEQAQLAEVDPRNG